MISIAIVEDDPACRQQLAEYVRQYGRETGTIFELELFSDGMDFIDDYRGGYDLIFMDIVMPHMNGLEAAHKLRTMDRQVCLIFITSMAQYAIRGYEVRALDFIVKPVAYELLCIKLEKAVAAIGMEKVYRIPMANGMKKVRLSEIVYIESSKHYLYFHIFQEHPADRQRFAGTENPQAAASLHTAPDEPHHFHQTYPAEEVYRMRSTLREVRDYFLENQFAAANSSLLINVSYIDGMQGNEISLLGKTFLIGRKYKAAFLDKLTTCICQISGGSRNGGAI